MKTKGLTTITASALLLAGCATGGPKQTTGTLLGAAGGALIGSQIGGGSGRVAAAAIGTLGGALLGGTIGKNMDDNDKKMSSETKN